VTEDQLAEFLRQRYTRIRRGTIADRYTRARHVRLPTAYGLAQSIADYMVLDSYGPGAVIGFEIKSSRADWLAEINRPQKAEAWRRYCHQWFLVSPDASIVRGDLPRGWGHLIVRGGKLFAQTPAPTLRPEPMPAPVLALLGRSIARTALREVGHE